MQYVGDFVLTGQTLGRGAYAPVYLAYHRHTQIPAAIKCIDVTQLVQKDPHNGAKRLGNEIRILKMVKHPNIVSLYDVKVTPDRALCYMAMEFCDMGDLNGWLARLPERRVSEAVALDLTRQLAAGLYCLRGINVVHRDLKPANILLCRRPGTDIPAVKIADFGFARETSATSMLQSVVGTPLYMAPEIILGYNYNVTTDLWSVGVILYEMLCGTVPFYAATVPILQAMLRERHVPRPPHHVRLSFYCQNLITALLTHDPTKRCTWEQFFHHPWLVPKDGPSFLPPAPSPITMAPQRAPVAELPPAPAPVTIPAPAPAPPTPTPAPEPAVPAPVQPEPPSSPSKLAPAENIPPPPGTDLSENARYLADLYRNMQILTEHAVTISQVADALAQGGSESHAVTLYLRALQQLRTMWTGTSEMLAALGLTVSDDMTKLSVTVRTIYKSICGKVHSWTKTYNIVPKGVPSSILYHHALELGKDAANKEASQQFEQSLHSYTLALNIFTILSSEAYDGGDAVALQDQIDRFNERKQDVRAKLYSGVV